MNTIKNDAEKQIKNLLNLFNNGNYDLVITKGKKIIRIYSEYVILYNIIGSAYLNTGKFTLAKEILQRGLKLDPNNIAIMNNLANTFKNLGNIESAEKLYLKIIEKKPNYINVHINFGNLKRDLNDFDAALKMYHEALKIDDTFPIIHYSLALAYQGLGNFVKAIEHANKTLSLEPKFTQADMLISQSTKYSINNDHLDHMEKKINNLDLNTEQTFNLEFALAKAHEDIGDIKKSFEYLSRGNENKRKTLVFDIKNEIKLFENVKKVFNNFDFEKNVDKKDGDKKIIFILGMPRSGTTLVEQIIGSHSAVYGAGELPYLSKIIQEDFMIEDDFFPNKFNKIIQDRELVNSLREKYYYFTNKFNSKHKFITDKAPLNFRWIGFIKILFPNSKIIHCSRNSKDNCLSLYKNLFEGGLNFSYNQKELGKYYNLYSDLINFWTKLLPDQIFNANYEEIVKNQEKQSKDILKFCGLEWEDQCLTFHKNKNPIKTMSTAQARKPIYKSSINSYEKFSSFLVSLNKII
jgi:tetratricopeptide (TPR) repeat protein